MMHSYPYDRGWLEEKNHWDIGYNNPDADPPIIEPLLNDEIFDAIGMKSIVRCGYDKCLVMFEVELTPEQKATLDIVVQAHKDAA